MKMKTNGNRDPSRLLKKVTDCAGEKGDAEQEQRPLHHGSFPKVSGATSARSSSGKCGFG
jgi:hypothetical protein